MILGILLLALLSLWSVTQVFAIYNSRADAELDSMNFAKFVFNMRQTDEVHLQIDNFLPGEIREYKFQVSNNDEVSRSDVTVKYKIYLESYRILPLKFSLVNEDAPDVVILSCGHGDSVTSEGKFSCSTDELILEYDDFSKKNYILKVEFPSTDSTDSLWSSDYAGMIDYINLKIKSWQKTE